MKKKSPPQKKILTSELFNENKVIKNYVKNIFLIFSYWEIHIQSFFLPSPHPTATTFTVDPINTVNRRWILSNCYILLLNRYTVVSCTVSERNLTAKTKQTGGLGRLRVFTFYDLTICISDIHVSCILFLKRVCIEYYHLITSKFGANTNGS